MTRDEIDGLPENKKPYIASTVQPAPALLEPAPVLLEPTPVLPESPPPAEPLEQTWRSENSLPKTIEVPYKCPIRQKTSPSDHIED